LNDDRVPF